MTGKPWPADSDPRSLLRDPYAWALGLGCLLGALPLVVGLAVLAVGVLGG